MEESSLTSNVPDIDLQGVRSLLNSLSNELCVPYYVLQGCTKPKDPSKQLESAVAKISHLEKELNAVVGISRILLDYLEGIQLSSPALNPDSMTSSEVQAMVANQTLYPKPEPKEIKTFSIETQTENDLQPIEEAVKIDIEYTNSNNNNNDQIFELLKQIEELQAVIEVLDEQLTVKEENNSESLKTIKELKNNLNTKENDILELEEKIEDLKMKIKTSEKKVPDSYYSNSVSYASYSSRCQATTQRGAQCKRNSQSGRSYCWQH